MFTMRFDLRAPAWGAPAADLCRAAGEMCSWAESNGCIAAVICEHRGSEDGYPPSPLVLAAAIAARTDWLGLSLVVLLPFYDPVRLAEEMSLLDIISHGRASYIFGVGHLTEELDHLGLDVADCGRLVDEKLDVLKRLLRGEKVEREGRLTRVTPQPRTPGGPMMVWGGGQVLPPDRDSATVCFVADDVDRAWDDLGEHLLHDACRYAEWHRDNETSAGDTVAHSVADLREISRSHRILSVAEAVDMVRGGEVLNLSPLCGGMPPDIAWPYLRRVGEVVMPQARS